jgi:uncharacterized protein
VGAHLLAQAQLAPQRVMYWRERDREVDYVVETPTALAALEVKSGRERDDDRRGLDAFVGRYQPQVVRMIGTGSTPLCDFLREWPR